MNAMLKLPSAEQLTAAKAECEIAIEAAEAHIATLRADRKAAVRADDQPEIDRIDSAIVGAEKTVQRKREHIAELNEQLAEADQRDRDEAARAKERLIARVEAAIVSRLARYARLAPEIAGVVGDILALDAALERLGVNVNVRGSPAMRRFERELVQPERRRTITVEDQIQERYRSDFEYQRAKARGAPELKPIVKVDPAQWRGPYHGDSFTHCRLVRVRGDGNLLAPDSRPDPKLVSRFLAGEGLEPE